IVLDKYGLKDRLIAITTDNASNNDTMMTQLENKLNSVSSLFQVEWGQVRCLAHAINLTVKQFFKNLFHSRND
ncbi:hypothetical protein HK096_000091, partial [Nowakowskiella sp. JEL0078]